MFRRDQILWTQLRPFRRTKSESVKERLVILGGKNYVMLYNSNSQTRCATRGPNVHQALILTSLSV